MLSISSTRRLDYTVEISNKDVNSLGNHYSTRRNSDFLLTPIFIEKDCCSWLEVEMHTKPESTVFHHYLKLKESSSSLENNHDSKKYLGKH
jgi:hypothetical protein